MQAVASWDDDKLVFPMDNQRPTLLIVLCIHNTATPSLSVVWKLVIGFPSEQKASSTELSQPLIWGCELTQTRQLPTLALRAEPHNGSRSATGQLLLLCWHTGRSSANSPEKSLLSTYLQPNL